MPFPHFWKLEGASSSVQFTNAFTIGECFWTFDFSLEVDADVSRSWKPSRKPKSYIDGRSQMSPFK
jgi:hypothetical protein